MIIFYFFLICVFHQDFVRILKEDSKGVWGEAKYFGGSVDGNWPGVAGRPPLVIPASTFVVHFHTAPDGSGRASRNRWGFRLTAEACDSTRYMAVAKLKANNSRNSPTGRPASPKVQPLEPDTTIQPKLVTV
jgi:hypothetical protein